MCSGAKVHRFLFYFLFIFLFIYFGRREEYLYCFARQLEPQQANPLKTVSPLGERLRGFYSLGVKNRAIDMDQGRCELALFSFFLI